MIASRLLCALLCVTLPAACSDPSGVGPESVPVGPWALLTAGNDHTCGLTRTGAAFCWGDNAYYGQLGNGSLTNHATPVAVVGGLSFTTLAAGWEATCGVTHSGATYCWGVGGQVQWPFTGAYSTTPIAVPINLTFTTLALGSPRCGLTGGGAAYCWTFARGIPVLTPVVGVAGELTFAALAAAAGGVNTCSVASSGAAYCWGWNRYGELGIGASDTLLHATPAAVVGGVTFTTLAVGDSHACGVTVTGAAYCWGYNQFGQLGNGAAFYPGIASPVAVVGRLIFTSLAAGGAHTCGLTSGGAAYCWGSNGYGELGYSTTSNDSATPTTVAGGLRFVGLTAGGSHTCGLTSGGAAFCWGSNGSGELGDGTTVDRSMPVRVRDP